MSSSPCYSIWEFHNIQPFTTNPNHLKSTNISKVDIGKSTCG